MILGDKASFAVEIELSPESGDEWMFGKICYWIDGMEVGDFGLGTSLRDVLFQMDYVVADCGNRNGNSLCESNSYEIYSTLNAALYEEGNPDFETTKIPDVPARFDVRIPVDVFDQWKIFLIECNESAKIVFKNINSEVVNEMQLDKGEFDMVIKNLRSELQKIFDLLDQ